MELRRVCERTMGCSCGQVYIASGHTYRHHTCLGKVYQWNIIVTRKMPRADSVFQVVVAAIANDSDLYVVFEPGDGRSMCRMKSRS